MLKQAAAKLEFVLLFFLFLSFELVSYLVPFFSITSFVLFVLFTTASFAYFYLFVFAKEKGIHEHFLFLVSILLFSIATILSPAAMQFITVATRFAIISLVFFVELFATFFMIALAVYFFRKNKKVSGLLFFSSFIVIMLLFGSRLVLKGMSYDDEMFIIVKSTQLLLKGSNPYGVSFAKQILENESLFLPTVSLQNKILGNLQYPPFFLLAYLPFYLVSFGNVETSFLVSYAFYLFVFIVVLFWSREKKKPLEPISLALVFIVSAGIVLISAVMDLLLTALLLLAYSKLESKYAWLILGLALATQELLWVPVLFLVVYLANEKGLKQAAKQLAGAVMVFLAISAWFIATKPASFFSSLFAPLYKPLPSNTSSLGFSLIEFLGVKIGVYHLLFGLYLLIFSLLLLYHNKKPLIFLFSMLVFLLYDRSVVTYYTIFGIVFAYAIFEAKEKRGLAKFTKVLRKNKGVFFAVLVLLLFTIALLIVNAHEEYAKEFDIMLSNQSLIQTPNSTILKGYLQYKHVINTTVYVFIGFVNSTTVSEVGLTNTSILLPKPKPQELCSRSECMADTNRISLNGTGEYNFTTEIEIKKIKCVDAMFYTNNFYYVAKPICNEFT